MTIIKNGKKISKIGLYLTLALVFLFKNKNDVYAKDICDNYLEVGEFAAFATNGEPISYQNNRWLLDYFEFTVHNISGNSIYNNAIGGWINAAALTGVGSNPDQIFHIGEKFTMNGIFKIIAHTGGNNVKISYHNGLQATVSANYMIEAFYTGNMYQTCVGL